MGITVTIISEMESYIHRSHVNYTGHDSIVKHEYNYKGILVWHSHGLCYSNMFHPNSDRNHWVAFNNVTSSEPEEVHVYFHIAVFVVHVYFILTSQSL